MLVLELDELTTDKKPYEFEGGTLYIRPYPAEKSNVILSKEGVVISGQQQRDIFMHCLVDWENVVDANDKPIKLTDKVKDKLFQFRLNGIVDFVITKSREFTQNKEDQEKN